MTPDPTVARRPDIEDPVDLDPVAVELAIEHQRILDAALSERQAAPRCQCERPWPDGPTHCLRCGREVGS